MRIALCLDRSTIITHTHHIPGNSEGEPCASENGPCPMFAGRCSVPGPGPGPRTKEDHGRYRRHGMNEPARPHLRAVRISSRLEEAGPQKTAFPSRGPGTAECIVPRLFIIPLIPGRSLGIHLHRRQWPATPPSVRAATPARFPTFPGSGPGTHFVSPVRSTGHARRLPQRRWRGPCRCARACCCYTSTTTECNSPLSRSRTAKVLIRARCRAPGLMMRVGPRRRSPATCV